MIAVGTYSIKKGLIPALATTVDDTTGFAAAMKQLSSNSPQFFGNDSQNRNLLWQYVQSLSPEVATQLSQPSSEAMQVMQRNIVGLLGALPPEQFDVTITTSRQQLGQMMASAMMTGYFLHSAEQRMSFEQALVDAPEPSDA